jgi:hypothetical protein
MDAAYDSGDALTDPWICFISAFSSLLRLLFMLLLLQSNLDTVLALLPL